jgi:hypothetical protein
MQRDVGSLAAKLDAIFDAARAGLSLQVRQVGPLADEDQRPAQPRGQAAHGIHEVRDAFAFEQATDEQDGERAIRVGAPRGGDLRESDAVGNHAHRDWLDARDLSSRRGRDRDDFV